MTLREAILEASRDYGTEYDRHKEAEEDKKLSNMSMRQMAKYESKLRKEVPADFDNNIEVHLNAVKRVQKAYKNADQRVALGINWAMKELFGNGWEKIK